MAFNGIFNSDKQEQIQIPQSPTQLSPTEIEVLLSLIKRSNFLGEDIEPLYNMVAKLQNQYLEYKSK
jgi:hypothetical protein